jgi:hypothetical protein
MLSPAMNINIRFAINWMKGKRLPVSGQAGRRVFHEKSPDRVSFHLLSELSGWMMGFEPTTLRTTI